MKRAFLVILTFVFSSFAYADQIQVIAEDGSPVAGATILIGQSINDPFEGNVFRTDANGAIQLPTQWKTSLPISIHAEGYVALTMMEALPISRSFVLSRQELAESLELNGMTDGFGRLRRDGKLDVGLVMPTFSREDLLSFDISSVISPETDTLSIAGRSFEVPSNITFPEQRERYFIPFTLNKPQYRTYSRRTGEQQFVASHAQFPVKRVIDKIRRGDSILSAINDFTFVGGGLLSTSMNSAETTENMIVNEFSYDETMTVKGASFGREQMMLSIAVNESEGRMYPTDLKFIDQGQEQTLSTYSNGAPRFIASMLTNRPAEDVIRIDLEGWDEQKPLSLSSSLMQMVDVAKSKVEPKSEMNSMAQMSITIQSESEQGRPPQFIELVSRPRVGDNVVRLTPPAERSTIVPVRTILVYSAIEKVQSGAIEIERRTRLWQLSMPGWVSQFRLPEVNVESDISSDIRRWEVIYLGVNRTSLMSEGLDEITHISRNSIDIQ